MIRCLALFSLVAAAALPTAPLVQDPAAAPGAEHTQLAKLAGDWTVVTTFRFGPGGPAQEFQGKAHGKVILGGRFVQFDETAVEFGAPVERQRTWGFNNQSRKYESTWMYTGSTAVMRLTGDAAADGKLIAGSATFAGDKGTAQDFTWTLACIDDDHFSSTLVAPAHGQGQAATFHALYTRAAAK
ncbi:MAG TPA: DUF1579 family protein [Planctomycetota bacterium]|nr:DUF1579 family protein [Planctomycetota bacterium]